MIERAIVEAAADLRRRREPFLVATVVATHGSAYRCPGARMLLTRFRWIAGSVSGGCLEGDISRKGWWHTREGAPVVVKYDSRVVDGADDDEVRAAFGLGCDGVVEVMLERAGDRLDPLEIAERCLRSGRRGAVATVYHSRTHEAPVGARIACCVGESPFGDLPEGMLRDAIIRDARTAIEHGESASRCYDGTDVLFEVILPPPHLFVLGTGHDAVPVVRLAKSLGWNVTVCARQIRVSVRERFAGSEVVFGSPQDLAARIDAHERAFAVVMGHDYDADREQVAMLLASRARYIGILGPRARTVRMLADLGVDASDARIHAPVGLELGAETPDEVALAIVAEIQSVLGKATAIHLRDRRGSIHERPTLAPS